MEVAGCRGLCTKGSSQPPNDLFASRGRRRYRALGYHAVVKWLSRLATGLFVVALPVLLVTTNVRFLAGEVRLYERGFREHDAVRRTGLPLTELDRAARDIVHYFEDDRDLLRIRVTANGEEESLFNARETEHMKDVKSLMQAVFRANEITLAFVLTYLAGVFLWAGSRSLRRLAVELLAGMGVGILAVGVVAIFAIVGFESTWEKFHELFFDSGSWQFNPATDRLIQMFPEPFWQEEVYILAGMTAVEALVIIAASLACLVMARRPARTPGEPQPIRVRPRRRREITESEPRA